MGKITIKKRGKGISTRYQKMMNRCGPCSHRCRCNGTEYYCDVGDFPCLVPTNCTEFRNHWRESNIG